MNLRPETVRHLLAIGHDLSEASSRHRELTEAHHGGPNLGHLRMIMQGKAGHLEDHDVQRLMKSGHVRGVHDEDGTVRLTPKGYDAMKNLREAWSPQARAAALAARKAKRTPTELVRHADGSTTVQAADPNPPSPGPNAQAGVARKFKKGDRVKLHPWGDMGTIMSDEVAHRNQGDPNATETTLAVMKDGMKAPLVYRKSDVALAEAWGLWDKLHRHGSESHLWSNDELHKHETDLGLSPSSYEAEREDPPDVMDKRVRDFFESGVGKRRISSSAWHWNSEEATALASGAGVPFEHLADMHRRGVLKRRKENGFDGDPVYGLAGKKGADPGWKDGELAYGQPGKRRHMEESAKTAALSVTHAPIGKGGTNWVTKSKPGNMGQLPAYIQNIRNAMMRDGKGESEATAMAVGAVKRWASGGGGVSGEVKAAAAKAVAQWEATKAAGKAAGKADEAGKKAA